MIVVTVPGLRGPVEDHWQTRLAAELHAEMSRVLEVPPLGHENASLAERIAVLQETVEAAAGAPVIIVAHSAGVLTTVHWVDMRRAASGPRANVAGALLATPPVLSNELPHGYPSLRTLGEHGWLPIPMKTLPFPSMIAASSDDPLGDPARVEAFAQAWGSRVRDIGAVGHLNPASGYGPWPQARGLIEELTGLENHE